MELYLITPPEQPFLERLSPVLRAGVDRLQYRRPGLTDREALRELRAVRDQTQEAGIPLVVNDRPDLALSVEAHGVHLGEDDLPVDVVGNEWPDLEVGRTQRVDEPIHRSADCLGVGPVFPSDTKQVEAENYGWEGVSRILGETDQPVYAIGGITPDRCEEAPAGLTGVAVIGAVWASEDPVAAVRDFQLLE